MIWKKYSHSIKTRLIVNVVLIHAFLMGFIVYDMLDREHEFMQDQLSTKAYDLTSILASNASTILLNNDLIALNELIGETDNIKEFYMTFIIDKDLKVRASKPEKYFNLTLNDEISKELIDGVNKSDSYSYQIIHDGLIDTVTKIYIDKNLIGYTRTLLSNKALENELSIITYKSLIYIILAIIFGALFAWMSVRKMTGSLNHVSEAAKKIAQQDFNIQLPEPKTDDEVSNVVKAFKVMQISLNQYLDDIQKAKQRYETLFKSNQAVELIIDPDKQKIIDFNDAALDFYGYTSEEMKGLYISDINVLSQEDIQEEIDKVKEHKRNYFLFKHRLANGDIKDVEVYSGAIEIDNKNYIYSIVHDISERVAIEKEKNEIQERLNLALEGTNDGLWDWNLITNEVYFSPRYKQMLGYEDNELKNSFHTFEKLLHPEDKEKSLNMVTAFLKSDNIYYEQNFRLCTKSGRYIPIMSRAKKFLDKNNDPIRLTGTHVDMTEITKAQEKLKFQAEHDALTGLPNRTLFLDRLNQSLKHAKRHQEKVAVLFMDLDHFKEVNDSLGHDIGDLLLIKVADLVQNTIRTSDTVARIGGDEFTIMIERIENNALIIDIMQKIINILKIPHNIGEHVLYTSFSIGVAVYPDDGHNADELLKNSDTAMYKAKSQGRNGYKFYTDDMTEKALQRVLLETSLRSAITNKEFEVYYQPQVDARNNKIIGMEALIRWNNPEKGLVSPIDFIPFAEESGFIIEIDKWVMHSVMNQASLWHSDERNIGRLSINISVILLSNTNFISYVKESLKQTKCDPQWLEFEITESYIMKDTQITIENLNQINKMGIKISIDDFGTGYSSLSYLKRLPIDKLKIDQTFIKDLNHDENDREIVRTIISMAKNLNMSVIAEGVETLEQKEYLLENGCNHIQGYLYYKPINVDEINKTIFKI